MSEESRGRVLVIDDERAMCDVLVDGLGGHGLDVVAETDAEAALRRLPSLDVDVVLTDLRLRGTSGLEVCRRALEIDPALPIIVMTAFGNLEAAVGAMRAGAYDFLTKPLEIEIAALAVARAIRWRRVRDELRRLREHVERERPAIELVGRSPAIERVLELVDRVRDSDVTVLVTGESGTGKELVARALHRRGRRAGGPFVAVNCAALPEALLESELFGHTKGAFTDARSARQGLFLEANAGTLLLDEVGEMPLGMQVKLLRALQDRRVRPVGSDRDVAFDARIVAATNRDLLAAVEEGRFREDLYYRLAVLEIDLPPLRARGNDVLLLAQLFLERAARGAGKSVTGLSPAAAERVLAHRWPGNVRELQNAMERAVAVARYDVITPEDLPARVRGEGIAAPPPADSDDLVPLDEVERRHVLRVLDALGGQRAQAARVLGIDRKTLYRKLERWGVPASREEAGD